MINLVTGRAGVDHITGDDLGHLNAGLVGSGSYVLKTGNQLKATVASANSVTIGDGDAVHQGRHIRVVSAESVAIQSGSVGVKRNDVIALRYSASGSGDSIIESASLAVLRGEATSGVPVDPEVPAGNVLSGDRTSYMPLYRIPINGVSVGEPVPLFDILTPAAEVWDHLSRAGRIFSGSLGKLPVDARGHIRLWTNAEFAAAFGASPKDCTISVNNPASGGSGLFLATPRWNGDAVWTTQMSVDQSGLVKASGADGVTPHTPVSYLVVTAR